MTGENEYHSYVFSFSFYTFQGVHGNIIIVYIMVLVLLQTLTLSILALAASLLHNFESTFDEI